ncbi:helix-turn-helix domain-containing protein [Thalassovita sp.]|uniref:helix-turn-helix domain-containing protein n=1 Tax=Thalassovita sp. TaxID=1979401 RepID=UPI002880BE66|nr:helix-turn-helix domain-containing protein [Thalassovita sp.]MDF1801711.1 helix-turn-helix domain-containing protein [Thalassovita sp.]
MSDDADVASVARVVADAFGITVADLQSKRRDSRVTTPRQIAYLLAHDGLGISLPRIGAYFGGRDHTTILHGVRRARDVHVQAFAAECEEAIFVLRLRKFGTFLRQGAAVFQSVRGGS